MGMIKFSVSNFELQIKFHQIKFNRARAKSHLELVQFSG